MQNIAIHLSQQDKTVKKLMAALIPMAFALTACVTDTTGTASTGAATGLGNGLAMTAVKIGVQAKCASEISNNAYWKTGSKLLTETQATELQTEVCSCVADKATTSVTAADLVTAALDKSSQATLASRVVASTLNACVVETLKN